MVKAHCMLPTSVTIEFGGLTQRLEQLSQSRATRNEVCRKMGRPPVEIRSLDQGRCMLMAILYGSRCAKVTVSGAWTWPTEYFVTSRAPAKSDSLVTADLPPRRSSMVP